jgi:hypothetical protein
VGQSQVTVNSVACPAETDYRSGGEKFGKERRGQCGASMLSV